MNDYRKGPLIETSAGRKVVSFSAFMDECTTKAGDTGTHVRDLATYEWNHGKKHVGTVVLLARRFQEEVERAKKAFEYYEIYVKPERGPCTVQERDDAGFWAWATEEKARGIAAAKKARYPHMDFIVHKLTGLHGPRSVVFDTSHPT